MSLDHEIVDALLADLKKRNYIKDWKKETREGMVGDIRQDWLDIVRTIIQKKIGGYWH